MKIKAPISIIMSIIFPIITIIFSTLPGKTKSKMDTYPSDSKKPVSQKKAMTWTTLKIKNFREKTYVLVGTDNITNPYNGDTIISQSLPILCIKKADLPKPIFDLGTHRTRGGAWRYTWSGGYIGLTPPVPGNMLTSLSVANNICAKTFGSGYQMAAFHDGDRTLWSGWDFWGEVVPSNILTWQNELRFWVYINDKPANPW